MRKVCPTCGDEFECNSNRQIYCSKCRPAAAREATRVRVQKFRSRWAWSVRRSKNDLGSSNLKANPKKKVDGTIDWKVEEKLISKEVGRIKRGRSR